MKIRFSRPSRVFSSWFIIKLSLWNHLVKFKLDVIRNKIKILRLIKYNKVLKWPNGFRFRTGQSYGSDFQQQAC